VYGNTGENGTGENGADGLEGARVRELAWKQMVEG